VLRLFRSLIRRDEGTTLTELLIVTMLMGMVLRLAYLMMGAVTKMADGMQARTVATDDGRQALDRMTRELRQAMEVTEGQGVFTVMGARQCTFYADVNQDGRPERITYRVSTNNLLRAETHTTNAIPPYTFSTTPTTEVVMSTVDPTWTGALFVYYSNADPPAVVASPNYANVSAVAVKLINSVTVNRSTYSVTQETWIKIRSVHNTID
jgi:Tfp pilus assembly protein PilW